MTYSQRNFWPLHSKTKKNLNRLLNNIKNRLQICNVNWCTLHIWTLCLILPFLSKEKYSAKCTASEWAIYYEKAANSPSRLCMLQVDSFKGEIEMKIVSGTLLKVVNNSNKLKCIFTLTSRKRIYSIMVKWFHIKLIEILKIMHP